MVRAISCVYVGVAFLVATVALRHYRAHPRREEDSWTDEDDVGVAILVGLSWPALALLVVVMLAWVSLGLARRS